MDLTAEVVVIGAGITGASIAYHLTKLGCNDVIVVEKEAVAAGETGPCPGGIRQQWGTEVNCRLARHSFKFWNRINEELEPEYPISISQGGYLFLAYSPEILDLYQRNVALQNQYGIPSRIITPAEICEIVPQLNPSGVLGASWCPEDGYANDPYSICAAFVAAARQRGVRFVFEEAVEFERDRNQLTGVRTPIRRIKSRSVVNCAGVNSPQVAAMAGVELPVEPELRRLAFTRPVEERILEPLVVSLERGFAAKQMYDGLVLISYLFPPDLEASDSEATSIFTEKIAELGIDIFPPLADMEFLRQAIGYYDSTPDHQAILGGVDGLGGYYQACGFSGHGFMMAPAVGQVMAELILGQEPSIPVDELHHRRFTRGELIPEPSVV